ncbi:hypothetical protein NDU88_006505, partial [Pleurodeles waltl]
GVWQGRCARAGYEELVSGTAGCDRAGYEELVSDRAGVAGQGMKSWCLAG